jgi:glutamate synthase domain-containing protein 2
LIRFLAELRQLSGGKPVGIKLCLGAPHEFAAIVRCRSAASRWLTPGPPQVAAAVELDSYPDFITVDGAEGGTGAAPSEFVNHVGTPFVDAVYVVHNLLVGAGCRDKVKLVASGKITSGFAMFRAFALGADVCNSARGMMFALGCIQSLKCHTNKCPTGVATQDRALQYGLVVPDKADRVYNFHLKTVEAALDLIAASGKDLPRELSSEMVLVRGGAHSAKTYAELFPRLSPGELWTGGGAQAPMLKQAWDKGLQSLQQQQQQPPPKQAPQPLQQEQV